MGLHAPLGSYGIHSGSPQHSSIRRQRFPTRQRQAPSADPTQHCLQQLPRTVIGAYKSTPVYLLHSEAGVPPIGLYLAHRRAVFLARPDNQAKAQAIRNTVYQTLSTHTRHPRPAVTSLPAPEESDWTTVIERWKSRWQEDATASQSSRCLAALSPCWTAQAVRRRRQHLTKAESSLLTQVRTGYIGVNAYLSRRGVVESPECQCGAAEETAAHVFLLVRRFQRGRRTGHARQASVAGAG